MTVHALHTKSAPDEITAAEAVRRYAEYLKEQSFCLDESSWPMMALHIQSNTESLADSLRNGFPDWAKAEKIRVKASDYHAFLQSLTQRLTYIMPRVRATSFRPVPEQIFTNRHGLRCANTFVPFNPAVPEVFVMPPILTEYLRRAFMTDEDRKFVPQFMADIVQNPTRRTEYGLYVQGVPGTGKTTIYHLVKAALGGEHCWENNSYTEPFAKFSEIWADHLLVCFDDAAAKKGTYLRLKQAITRKSMKVQIKGQQKLIEREIYSRVLICSNLDAEEQLRGEKGERRLYVTEPSGHEKSVEDTEEFYVRFYAWMDEPTTPAILYHWLKSIDLSDFKSGSMTRTPAHAAWLGLSTSSFADCLESFVTPEPPYSPPVFLMPELLSYLTEQGFRYPDHDAIKAKLNLLGYEVSRRVVDGCNDGKKVDLWQPKPKAGRAPSLTPTQTASIIAAFRPSFP
jgi:hypothetical protein